MILPLIISNTGDMKKNWFIWKQDFLDYMNSNNYNERPEEYKISILRSLLGNDALRISSVRYIFDNRSHKLRFTTLSRILERLDDCFSDMKNELVERYNFFTRYRQKDEPIETYILDLIEKAKTCNFGNLRDSIIRDKVIASIPCNKFRSKLFQTLNLNLQTLLHIISKAEEAQNKYNNFNKKIKTQTNALDSDEIALEEASNNSSKKVAEGKQNSNDKVNGKITVQAKENSKNDKSDEAKTNTQVDNSGNNILSNACKENNTNIDDKIRKNPKNYKSGKAKTDTKVDNSGNNILSTACRENTTNIDNKVKTNSKYDIRNNNIIIATNRRHSDNSNKAKTDSKMHNSGNNITSTVCQENNANIGDKTKTNSKNDKNGKAKANTKVDNSGGDKTKTNAENDISSNNIIGTTNRRHSDNSNYVSDMELVFGKNTNNINDKDNIDSKGMNSNPNMNTARRNSVSLGTQYGRNCRKCNENHAGRSCPAWGHKCENCGEYNHFRNCCQIKPLKTTEQHKNMSSVERENLLNPNHFQYNNQPQPIPPSNYLANIEPCYLPSAPLFCEIENELYPKLCLMSNVQAWVNPEATVDNTEPEAAATNTENHKKRSNSDTCSIS